MNFKKFSAQVNEQFNQMAASGILLHSKASKDAVWKTYIQSFPEGADPKYLTNTTHDCNCCKSFLRQVGNVVIVKDGVITTLWDNHAEMEYPYNVVAKALHKLISNVGIDRTFRPTEKKYGAQITYTIDAPEKPRTFNHFYCIVPEQHQQANHDVLMQYNNNFIPSLLSLQELNAESVETVSDLIGMNNLARGEEQAGAIASFAQWQDQADNATELELFVWENINYRSMAIRNTAIGSLLKDLSKGKPLEASVKSYEKKVAGDNYKRPKKLITSGMIKKATEEIEKRGLEPSLYRRHAKPSDMSVNDILFVDRTIQKDMKDSILAELVPQKVAKANPKAVPSDIAIDAFLTDVLPNITILKAKFENRHTSNLVNIFAAINQDAPKLFKWNNQFSWGYNGSCADSLIKQNVSKAGGDVTGNFRVSLGWQDSDDLDLSLTIPKKQRLYFQFMRSAEFVLDVDMNAAKYGFRFDPNNPVENITRANYNAMPIGEYGVVVHNYDKRTNSRKGFTLEVEILGTTHVFTYPKQLENNRRMSCITLYYDGNEMKITKVHKDLSDTEQSQKVWELHTNDFYRVNLVTMSPNHWSENTGNRHYMFMLEGCLNPDKARAIYNEFLIDELMPIRKTFEVLGSKALVDYSEDQLAGLGFSSTKRNSMVVLADGRPYNILF